MSSGAFTLGFFLGGENWKRQEKRGKAGKEKEKRQAQAAQLPKKATGTSVRESLSQ